MAHTKHSRSPRRGGTRRRHSLNNFYRMNNRPLRRAVRQALHINPLMDVLPEWDTTERDYHPDVVYTRHVSVDLEPTDIIVEDDPKGMPSRMRVWGHFRRALKKAL